MKKYIVTICLLNFCLLFSSHFVQATNYKYPTNNKVLFYAPGFSTPGDEQDEITNAGEKLFNKATHFNANVVTSQKVLVK